METEKITFSQEEKNRIKHQAKLIITTVNNIMFFANADRLTEKDAKQLSDSVEIYSKQLSKLVTKGE